MNILTVSTISPSAEYMMWGVRLGSHRTHTKCLQSETEVDQGVPECVHTDTTTPVLMSKSSVSTSYACSDLAQITWSQIFLSGTSPFVRNRQQNLISHPQNPVQGTVSEQYLVNHLRASRSACAKSTIDLCGIERFSLEYRKVIGFAFATLHD